MPLESFRDELAERRRSALFVFYVSALVSSIAIALTIAGGGTAVLFLLRFLHSNDEREQQVNFQALTFAFAGTLVFSVAIGLFQSFGFRSLSWLGIPPLMIVLWSLGLILYSWRYR